MPQVSSDKKVKQPGVAAPISAAQVGAKVATAAQAPAAAPSASQGYARDRSAVQPPPQRAARHPNAILGDTFTRGASAKTAAQDGLAPGVAASHQMAKTDLPEIAPHSETLTQVAAKYRLPPALLAAVISRESRGGKALDAQGRGDHGYGVGVMQVDTDYHKPEGGGWDRAHLEQGARILADQLAVIRHKHPDWPPALQLRGAVAAYNMGPAKVQTIAHMDVGSTGGDYSSDVWARAQYYAKHVGAEPAVTEAAKPSAGGKEAPGGGADAPAGGSRDERSTAGSGGPSAKPEAASKSPQASFKGWYVKAPEAERVSAGRMLRLGHAGAAVREVQQRLGLEVDGLFGPQTEAAVKRFQAEHGLTPPPGREGNVGPTTLDWLRKTTAAPAAKPGAPATPAAPSTQQAGAPQPGGPSSGGPSSSAGQSAKQPPKPGSDPRTAFEQAMQRGKVLGMGDSGPEVKGLQQALGLSSAGQTGRFGPTTEAQVKAFQRQHGLAIDGRVGPDTFGALQAGGGSSGGTISPAGRAAMTALAKVAARNSHKAPAGKCYGAVLGPQASAYSELAASEHGSKLYKQMADSIPSSHTSYAVQLAHWLLSKGKDGVTAADKMGFRVIEADGKTTLGQYLAKRPELKGAIAVVPYGQQGTASREWDAAAAYGNEKWGRGVGDVCVVTGTGAQPQFVADGGIRHERATMWWLVHPK